MFFILIMVRESLLIALLAFNAANQESEKKRARLQDVWAEKRRNAAQKPVSAMGPKCRQSRSALGALGMTEGQARSE